MASLLRAIAAAAQRRWRPIVWTVSLALGALVLLAAHARWERPQGGGFAVGTLPGFDTYVYAAMAERPSVFTVAPWGYRVLTPTLAHLLLPSRPLRAFRWISLAALTAAALMVFAFTRRVGFRGPAACAGMVAFCISSPVGEALKNPFPGDGLAVAFEAALLLCAASGASVSLVLVLLALSLLTKDVLLLFVPLVYLPLRRRIGCRGAFLATAGLTLVALALGYALRAYWTPQIRTPHPALNDQLVNDLVNDLRTNGRRALLAALLGGLLPVALFGAFGRAARPFLLRYGYAAALTLLLPFFAWVNVPATRVYGFFGDVPRLHIYALPLLIPLALFALDRLWHAFDAPADAARARLLPEPVSWALLGTAALVSVLPFLTVDTYRRYPLHGRREGFQVFQTCRASLRVAERLARGDSVELTSRASGSDMADDLARRRWYLMEGWPDDAVFGTGDFILRDSPGVVLVPCLARRALAVRVRTRAPRATTLEAAINDQPLSAAALPEGTGTAQWQLPADALFRGDNVLRFKIPDGSAVVFESLSLGPGASAR